MYSEKKHSAVRNILIIIFVALALVAVAACSKFIIDRIGSTNEDGETEVDVDCGNAEGMETLEKAGVFGDMKPKCKKK